MLKFINSFDTFGSSICPHGATIFERNTNLLYHICVLLYVPPITTYHVFIFYSILNFDYFIKKIK